MKASANSSTASKETVHRLGYDPKFEHSATAAWMLRLTTKMYGDYGITDFDKPVCRNRRASSCYHRRGSNWSQLVFGYASIQRAVTRGFTEYTRIAWACDAASRAPGNRGAWCLTLHEFAHVLQFLRGGRYPGSIHNEEFVRCLRELQAKYPYRDAINL
jgi:hypothetical protein